VHQVGDQPRLYYDAWSTNHQENISCLLILYVEFCTYYLFHLLLKAYKKFTTEQKAVMNTNPISLLHLRSLRVMRKDEP